MSNIEVLKKHDTPVCSYVNYKEGDKEYWVCRFKHDNHKDKIIKYNYAGGAGCGCDAKPLILEQNGELIASMHGRKLYDAEILEKTNKLANELWYLTLQCKARYRDWSVVQIDGSAYILADIDIEQAQKFRSFPYLFDPAPNRELYKFQDGKFVKICAQSAQSQAVIAHEALPKEQWGELNYKPVE